MMASRKSMAVLSMLKNSRTAYRRRVYLVLMLDGVIIHSQWFSPRMSTADAESGLKHDDLNVFKDLPYRKIVYQTTGLLSCLKMACSTTPPRWLFQMPMQQGHPSVHSPHHPCISEDQSFGSVAVLRHLFSLFKTQCVTTNRINSIPSRQHTKIVITQF